MSLTSVYNICANECRVSPWTADTADQILIEMPCMLGKPNRSQCRTLSPTYLPDQLRLFTTTADLRKRIDLPTRQQTKINRPAKQKLSSVKLDVCSFGKFSFVEFNLLKCRYRPFTRRSLINYFPSAIR